MNRKDINSSFYQSTFDIYVGNVNKNIEEADLKQIFAKFGEVKQVLCRRKDDNIGYAIVKFVYKLDAERVIRLDEVVCKGHHLPVKAARRSDQSNPSNGPHDSNLYSFPEQHLNIVHPGANYSNTDFGYFQPPLYKEDHMINSQPVLLEVLCTNVEDGITFYGYLCNRAEELAFLATSLNQLNMQQPRFDRIPLGKKVYAALFSVDNSWYRCAVIQSILQSKPGMCLVRYIDYGNLEEVPYRNIIDIPDSLQKIPPFSYKFTFSNLICDGKPHNKQTYLHQLVNKRMSLSAILLNGNHEYQVIKCSCNGKDVILETVSKGFAKPKRFPPPRPDTLKNNIPKQRAFHHGPETKANNTPSPVHVLKAKENCNIPSNNNNNKVPHKVPLKKNPGQKPEEAACNGTSQKEPDFHPMRIIKRGCELSDVLNCNGDVTPPVQKVLKPQAALSMLDSVIPNLKLINNIRSLVSQSSDDSIIKSAVDLLKEEISTNEKTQNSKQCVESAYSEYSETQNKIKKCLDKGLLSSLKLERDLCRSTLCDKLKTYLGSCDSSIFERKEKIQKTIIDLESNSNAWMNVQLDRKPNNLEELITEYNTVKENRWKLVSETREITNEKHKIFMDLLSTLQKELFLNTLEEAEESSAHLNETSTTNKAIAFSEKFKEALANLGEALDKELQMLTLNKEEKAISVIRCLLDILDTHKEKVDSFCELYENHYAMYNELTKLPDVETTLRDLATIEEEVHNITLKLTKYKNSMSEAQAVKLLPENTEFVKELHRIILKEDYLKAVLAKASDLYFPELNVDHPELRLFDFSRNKSLLKNWRLDYFINLKTNVKRNSSFGSLLLDEPVTIKKYSFENREEADIFIKKSILWNETKSSLLVQIKALFEENGTNVYVILPPVSSTLLDRPLLPSPVESEGTCRMLRDVLGGLRDIHKQNLLHRCLHPLTVVSENNRAMLDFCFDANYLEGLYTLRGINFTQPENKSNHESSDMYRFGCLVLWALFPNLSFTATADGVPNIAAFRSIIEELILPKDYALLCSLVDANPERRPTSAALLSRGFLSKYEAYCRSQCEAQKA